MKEPSERPKPMLLADVVCDRLRRAIMNGDFSPDERLPGENALAEQHQVSRPVIRAALLRLRAEGLVTSRQGSVIDSRRSGLVMRSVCVA